MRKLAIPKYLRQPLLLGGIPIVAVLLALWLVQQNNVNSLAQQINALQQQIDTLPAKVAPKDKLVLKKDLLTLEKDRINAQNAIYGTLVQALGGVFFGVTAYFTYRNIRATEANVRAAEEKQVTERFSKAIELLGSEKLEVRLGGIYALERIAKDSPKDHWTIMEVLTSFIQEKSPLDIEEGRQENPPKITKDIQAALTVVRRRDAIRDPEHLRLDLQKTNLRGACLGAYLLEDEYITANFRGTNFYETYLVEADLKAANLSESSLAKANLSDAILEGASLENAQLHFAILVGTKLMGAVLRKAIFEKANLEGAVLYRTDAREASFFDACLSGASFRESNLQLAKLQLANLEGAVLGKANLSRANLAGANLTRANLRGANLRGANLTEAIGLTLEQISEATTDEKTKLPDYLQSPKSLQPEPPVLPKP